ncbi:brevican core protein-like [Rissa tridactyla]|uniref:brevican core protein-like n=1 Tax=Rissa tridactyla TaxID=75485 RepID=UPI0023BAD0DE|nr:brevican core protein-like [Rissa tridactyla]
MGLNAQPLAALQQPGATRSQWRGADGEGSPVIGACGALDKGPERAGDNEGPFQESRSRHKSCGCPARGSCQRRPRRVHRGTPQTRVTHPGTCQPPASPGPDSHLQKPWVLGPRCRPAHSAAWSSSPSWEVGWRPPPAPDGDGGQTADCPKNWIQYRGSCYGYFNTRMTWAEAEEECNRYGPMGHLASIHSEGASMVLARYVDKEMKGVNTWIGLQDEEHTRRWKWSDDSTYNYESWAPGQPNNLWDREDCVVLDAYSGFKLWHDYPCDDKFPFLCRHQL